MTPSALSPTSPNEVTGRLTGVLYLGIAVTGLVSFLFVRNEIYVAGDATTTLANLVAHPGLAQLGVAADLTLVLTQSLAALWFYRTFCKVDAFAAGALAVFGTINAVAILGATVMTATAFEIGQTDHGAMAAEMVLVLYHLAGSTWTVAGLFFGLWLIPMGILTVRATNLPKSLGVVLVAGGLGYVLDTYLHYLLPGLPEVVGGLLILVATVGEFWMIGVLLVRPVVMTR